MHSAEGSWGMEGPRLGHVQDLQGGTLRRGSESVSALEGQAWGPPWWSRGMQLRSRGHLRETEGGGCQGRGIACAGGPFRVLREEE